MSVPEEPEKGTARLIFIPIKDLVLLADKHKFTFLNS
jgi:hypothetical protein